MALPGPNELVIIFLMLAALVGGAILLIVLANRRGGSRVADLERRIEELETRDAT